MISRVNNSNNNSQHCQSKPRLADSEFIDVWNRSANSVEAATAAGMGQNAAKCRASVLRGKGYALKEMPSGVRLFAKLPQNYEAEREVCSRPTGHAPGSPGKIEVLAARVRAGEELWHPMDIEGSDVG